LPVRHAKGSPNQPEKRHTWPPYWSAAASVPRQRTVPSSRRWASPLDAHPLHLLEQAKSSSSM
jgi:hypothetical protein